MLRRVARRHSLCADDADDAFQRASLILLTKAPAVDPGRLIAWMVVVTKHEAMAVRAQPRAAARLPAARSRARRPAGRGSPPAVPIPPSAASGVAGEARAALAALKANERLAIVLQAQGYSYAEICELCGWTYTKVNRSLAEGRARGCAGSGPWTEPGWRSAARLASKTAPLPLSACCLDPDVVNFAHRRWRLLRDVDAVDFLHLLNKPLANGGIRLSPAHWGLSVISLEVDDG